MAGKAKDYTGQTFGRLTFVRNTGLKSTTSYLWECRCACGEITVVKPHSVTSGHTRSCGCLQKEDASARFTKHGCCKQYRATPLYHVWENMKARCNNPNDTSYEYYGARGITVCDSWNSSYEMFRDYMLALPHCPKNALVPDARLERTIDRIRNNEGYTPDNVRWGTKKQQMTNMRRNRIVTINGDAMPLSVAVERYGRASYMTIYNRLHSGWPMKKAFLTPETSRVV